MAIGIGVDIVDPRSDLSEYQIVLAPTLLIAEDVITEKLYHYVEGGGCLLLTNRSGVKDTANKCIMSPLPTVFAELVGAHVEEYDVIGEAKQTMEITDKEWSSAFGGNETICTRWCDLLKTDRAQTLAVYHDQFYRGTPAVTKNIYGKGIVYYVGTVLERRAYIALAKVMASGKNLEYIHDLPLGVEVTYRQKQGRRWRFVFNNTMEEQNVPGEGRMQPFHMKIREMV
jgi:beta-galactosidase